jgi:hypothetical protein
MAWPPSPGPRASRRRALPAPPRRSPRWRSRPGRGRSRPAGGNADNANAQLMAAGAPPSSALAFATMNSAALRPRRQGAVAQGRAVHGGEGQSRGGRRPGRHQLGVGVADSAALTASAAAAGGNADNANAQLMAAGAPPSSGLCRRRLVGRRDGALGRVAAGPDQHRLQRRPRRQALRNRALPPRAPLQPVLVWTGRDPAESAIAATDEAGLRHGSAGRRDAAARRGPLRHGLGHLHPGRGPRGDGPPSRSIAATGATVPQPKLLARHKGAAPAAASAFASTSLGLRSGLGRRLRILLGVVLGGGLRRGLVALRLRPPPVLPPR